MEPFNTERFIAEIEVRRGIWDVSSAEYLNKDIKRQLWLEITNIFGNDNMSERDKEELGIFLKKKWKNIRDCFQRELRRSKGVKGASTANRRSTYAYFNLLQFLMPYTENTPINFSPQYPPLTPETDNDDIGLVRLSHTEKFQPFKRKMKRESECNEIPVSILINEDVNAGERKVDFPESDCDRLFLLSMLDDFRKIPSSAKMKARIEIIKIVEKYQSHRFQGGRISQNLCSRFHVDSNKGSETCKLELNSEYSGDSQ